MFKLTLGMNHKRMELIPWRADTFVTYCINDLNLPIVGLMCIPPINEEPSMHFSLLKKIASRNKLSELSMGMSSDYEDAIKFGATSVRIGSLFLVKDKLIRVYDQT